MDEQLNSSIDKKEYRSYNSQEPHVLRIKECPICGRWAFNVRRTKLILDLSTGAYELREKYDCNGCNASYWQSWRITGCAPPSEDFPGNCPCGGQFVIVHGQMDEVMDTITETYKCEKCGETSKVSWKANGFWKAGGPETSVYVYPHEREDCIVDDRTEVFVRRTKFMSEKLGS